MVAREHICQDFGQSRRVLVGERAGLIAVDVEHRDQVSRGVPDRQDQFRACGRGAGDVSGESVDIRHELHLARAGAGAADTAVEGYDETPMPSLIGSDLEQPGRDDPIETRPVEPRIAVVHFAGHRCHQRDDIVFAVRQRIDPGSEGLVASEIIQIINVSHGHCLQNGNPCRLANTGKRRKGSHDMQMKSQEIGEVLVVTVLDARIDAAVAVRFKNRMMELATTPSERVVLDLSHVEFLDSSGLGAVVGSMKQLGRARRLDLAGLTPTVEKVFRITRMDRVFRIFPSTDAAIEDIADAS